MAKIPFSDEQMDALLTEALACDAQLDDATATKLKRKLAQSSSKHSPSLWWLPALSGTVLFFCSAYVLSLVADHKFLTVFLAVGGLFVLSAWLLTIIGIIKFDSFKEACKLI